MKYQAKGSLWSTWVLYGAIAGGFIGILAGTRRDSVTASLIWGVLFGSLVGYMYGNYVKTKKK